jgi:hypothetical protein
MRKEKESGREEWLRAAAAHVEGGEAIWSGWWAGLCPPNSISFFPFLPLPAVLQLLVWLYVL